MAVTFDTSDARNVGGGTTVSFSYTVTGSNTLLFTGVTQAVTSITYNGAALSSIGTSGSLNVFSKTGPSTGSNTLSFSFSSYSGSHYAVTGSFAGVDQTTPLGTVVTNSGSSSAPSTGSITCPASGAIYGQFFHNYSTATPTVTSGIAAGLITSFTQTYGGAYDTSTKALSWSVNKSGSWWTVGVPINQVSAGADVLLGQACL